LSPVQSTARLIDAGRGRVTMPKKVVVVAIIIVFSLAILQFSLNPPQMEALRGLGINKALVIGAVVVLAALSGYYVWATSRRR
jgi:hypothetical protein